MLKKSTLLFIGVSFAFSWGVWSPILINKLFHTNIYVWPYQFFIASFGPMIGAFAAVLSESGLKGLSHWLRHVVFNWQVNKSWVIIPGLLLSYFLVSVLATGITGGSLTEMDKWGLSNKLPGLSVWQVAIVWMLTFGLGEESGWRGWLFPKFCENWSALRASIVVAVIWMLWHLPAFGFNPNYQQMGWGVIGWGISLAYGSVLLSWMYLKFRSIIPLMLWHGGFDLLTASEFVPDIVPMIISMLVIVHGVILSRELGKMGNSGSK